MFLRAFQTLNKLVVVTLLGGFAMLLIEVRYAHRDVLGAHQVAWTPILYSGLMMLVGVVALLGWDHGGRRVLFWGFAVALLVGPVGAWLHNEGRPLRGFARELRAWTQPVGPGPRHEAADVGDAAGEHHPSDGGHEAGAHHGHGADGPPALAPLAFVGLGLLGMLACADRFQPGASGPDAGRSIRGPDARAVSESA